MKLTMQIDLKPFAEGLKSAVKMTDITARQMRDILTGIRIGADTSEIDAELESLQSRMGDVPTDTMTEFDGDASGVESASDQADNAIGDVPETHQTDFEGDASNLLGTVSQIGMAYQGASTAIGQLSGKIGGLTQASDTQEKADQRLMLVAGDLTEELSAQADEIQNLTMVGDEVAQSYMIQAQNMGFLAEESGQAARDAIGLSNKYAEAGLTSEVAIKGMALAREGDFNMLKRYIPALRTATDATDAQNILNEAAADGWRLATQEVNSGYGAIEQYNNLVGDTNEILGGMIRETMYPFIKVLSESLKYLNSHPGALKILASAFMGLAAATAFLTIKQIALNTAKAIGAALTGNWIGLAAAAAIGVAAWAAGNAVLKSSQDKANQAIKEGADAAKDYKTSIDEMISSNQQYIEGLNYDQAIKDLKEVQKELEGMADPTWKAVPLFDNEEDKKLYDKRIMRFNELSLKEQSLKAYLAQNNKEYYEELKFEDAGYYDYKLGLLEKERQDRIDSDAWTQEQADAAFEVKKTALDGELQAYTDQQSAEVNAKRKAEADKLAAAKDKMEELDALLQEMHNKTLSDEFEIKRQQIQMERDAALAIASEAYLPIIEAEKQKGNDITALEQELADKKLEINQNYAIQAEILDTQETEAGKAKRAAEMQAEISLASQKRQLGIMTLQELVTLTEQYVEWTKSAYGEGSAQYLAALENLKAANQQFMESESFQSIGHSLMDAFMLSDEDQAAISQAYQYASSTVSQIMSQLSANMQADRQADMDDVEAKAKAEGWTAEKLAAEKEKIAVKYEKKERELKKKQQKLAIAQAVISTSNAVMKTYAQWGFPWGIIPAAAVGLLGAYNISLIAQQQFAKGGLVKGGEQIIQVNEQGEEFILNNRATRTLGTGVLNYLNQFPEKARGLLSGLPMINERSIPQLAFAGGGSTATVPQLDFAGVIKKIDEAITSIRALNLNVVSNKPDINITVETSDPETRIRKDEEIRSRMRGSGETI